MIMTVLGLGTLSGCGSGDGVDMASSGTPVCGAGGVRFVVSGTFSASSKDAMLYKNNSGGIIGLGGTVGASQFLFRRVGDLADGDLASVTTYDVSQYPYNLGYVASPMLSGCEMSGGINCSGFYALGGTFAVTKLSPTYEATFSLNMLHDGAAIEGTPGILIAGAVTGCVSIPNP